ncbi:hypothetical protein [Roseateles sp.]|uniref:hypothetical protein n=1 Tax=Roseateles sp. TaxID=1971397 RepID=UPI003D152772
MKMLVVATEAVVANEGKWNAIASQISAAYDARRNELLNMAEQSKLRARLEQVMSPVYYDEVIDLGRMRSCAIRSELKSLCSYRSVAVAAAKMRVLAARTAADPLGANVVAMALNDPAQIPIEVSFGDGWSTANDPAYRGKALNATSEVEHAYLTPGRYRVRTEFRLPEGGRFMQEEDLEVTQSADSAAAPTALRISPPVVLADQPVTLSVAVETPTSFRDLTARLIALGADGVPRAQCDIPSPNPGAVLAAGTYALTGCGQLVKATDQGLSIAVSALAKDGVKSRRAELMVAVSPKALVVQALTASQSSAGQPINGSFSVAGSSVSLVRVHAGLSASDTYCYTDLAATTGAKTFSFSGSWAGQNGKACSALLPAAGGTTNIVFKVEARDSNNNLANSGTPPTATVAYQAASTPISVTALTASQSSAGQPINGSFSVAGSSVSLVRVHAGLSASDTYCYTDLAATTGAKTFSFSGSWAGQNGKACSALLPAAGGTTNIVFKVEARDSNNNLANSGTPPTATVAYQAASTPISVTALTASQSSAGQPINGSFSVAGSSVSLVRVHAGLSASDTYCYTDLSASTGAKSFSFSGSWTGQNGKACSALLPAAGGTTNIVFKVEARDSNNNLANSGTPPTATVAYQAASTPISVTALTASQSSAGQPINGSFSVAGSSVSLVRVHAGLSASDTYCYTDLSASTGAKSFSFSGSWTGQNGKACSALLPAAGGTTNIVFKVEARDSNNNLANSGTPPTATVAYQAASTPISVTALTASQSSAGQPINGSFSVAGSSVSLVRVHAGLSASDTYCYTDLAATTGAKTFSFSGSWTGQNGKACSALLPAAGGTTNIVFKVEARDSNNNLANSGTPPTATVAYQAASTPISVTALTASQSSAGQPINGSFSVAGSSVSLVRVHAGLSASDTYCYTDLSASTGAKSFSFSGSWTGQNGKACSALLPAAGATTNIVFKVEARDSNNNLANSGTPPTATVAYQAASTPISVTALTASQSSAGQPINGSFSVAGSSVSLVRVHAGLSASDTYCYTDLSASTGAKSFSFSGSWTGQNGKACSALLPAAGATTNIVFKVEARDSNNNLANSGTPPTATVAYQAASTPISVTALTASQSSAGQPINGSFAVAGSSVSLVRVHAGLSASDTYCYTDLSASTGAKSFSFSGSWAGQNGKACSALLPAAGATTNIVFKVEARDSNNNLANSGTPPTATVAYQAATLASVTGRSPSSLTRNSATAVTVSGVGFPDTVVFAIDNVVCNGDYVRTATSVRQTCTAQNGTPSSVALLVKTQSGGNTLIGGDRNFSFAVR